MSDRENSEPSTSENECQEDKHERDNETPEPLEHAGQEARIS